MNECNEQRAQQPSENCRPSEVNRVVFVNTVVDKDTTTVIWVVD